MTVKELIEKLKLVENQDAKVYVYSMNGEDGDVARKVMSKEEGLDCYFKGDAPWYGKEDSEDFVVIG